MDFEDFKRKYPDIHGASYKEGKAEGIQEGLKQGEAKGRREGVKAALSQAADLRSRIKNEEKSMTVEERAKLAWDRDPKLRTEFDGDYDAYLAVEQMISKGMVTIIGGVVTQ